MGSSAKTGKIFSEGHRSIFLHKSAIWHRKPPHLHIKCSLYVCRRVHGFQIFKQNLIISIFLVILLSPCGPHIVPIIPTSSPHHPHSPHKVPMWSPHALRLWSPLSPPHVVPIVPMVSPSSPSSPCHPHIIPTLLPHHLEGPHIIPNPPDTHPTHPHPPESVKMQ